MLEVLGHISEIVKSVKKDTPQEFRNYLNDVNIVAFFSKRNVDTLDRHISESSDGSYSNLKFLLLVKTSMDNTIVDGRDLTSYIRDYVSRYIKNLIDFNSIETPLFIDKSIIDDGVGRIDGLHLAAFAVALLNKHRG